MSCEGDNKRKCFTFIWKLENATNCWQDSGECIESPSFSVDEIQETDWKLRLYPSIQRECIGLYLKRQENNKSFEYVNIDCDLSFLSSDGAVLLHGFEKKYAAIDGTGFAGCANFALRNDVFSAKRSVFLPQDTLTVRCRMWKSAGEMLKEVQCFARTRITVEKRSFLWSVKNFSTLKSHEKKAYEIKSLDNSKKLMSLELFSTGGLIFDEKVRLKIIPDYQNIKMASFQLSVIDDSKNTVKCFREEFWCHDSCVSKDFTLFCKKSELLQKKSTYLPNDVLSLSCECSFSFGTMQEEIEKIESDGITVAKKKSDNCCVDTENEFSVSKCILLGDLKSMLNNNCVADVKLKTKSQIYPSHTFILSARSPVFKSMFSSDMKEKINGCVDIEDLNDDTVLRMLHYIYCAEVEELDWTSAIELYEAADKYQILSLKDICSSYLKSNLVINNACEALVLADQHQDEVLKGFVQDFILRHGKEIVNSEEWDQLMETNWKLAAETMRLKFKE